MPEYAQHKGLITEYLAYECHRTRVDEKFDLRGTTIEHMRILDWYFSVYAQHRKRKLPLSRAQIAFLNEPIPVLDLARQMSIISYSTIRRELGQHWDLNDARIAREAIYWWSVERTPVSHLQDSLVPNYYVDVLNEVEPHQRWEPYHLNFFANRYHQVHPELHFLKLERRVDRIGLFVYLILACAREPHLVRFLSRDAVGRLLAPLPGLVDFCVFDSVLAVLPSISDLSDADIALMGNNSAIGEISEKLVSALEYGRSVRNGLTRVIENAGYSLRSGRRIAGADSGHSAACYDPPYLPRVVEGISVIGPLQAASGLGQAARMSLETLRETSWAVSARNFQMDNPAPVGFSSSLTLKDEVDPRQINLIHLNAESIPLAIAYLEQSAYRKSYNIGFFFWELSRIPACHHLALKLLDEIWVSSEYNREIYSSYTDIPVINVGMAVEPVNKVATITRHQLGIKETSFVFLTTFDSFSFVERKNPLGVVKAFQNAFPDRSTDAVLVIKTQNRYKVDDPYQHRLWAQIFALSAQDPRLIIINETLSYADLLGLKSICDCYVSLHRSEGWGFGMIEAMQLGLPVIATGYSGNLEFCKPHTCYLVDYDLVEPRPEEYIFVERGSKWAEPRLDSAAGCMTKVFEDRAGASSVAEAGKALVNAEFSVSSIARRYGERLDVIAATLGLKRTPQSASRLEPIESPHKATDGLGRLEDERAPVPALVVFSEAETDVMASGSSTEESPASPTSGESKDRSEPSGQPSRVRRRAR